MNQVETNLKMMMKQAILAAFSLEVDLSFIVIELPKEKSHGDYATNVAMRLSKELKQNPKSIAEALLEQMDKASGNVSKAEIAGPGFINFFMDTTSMASIINDIIMLDKSYGSSNVGNQIKVNLEYVSANPTGDLHPGHARGAAIGDSVARIMKFAGYQVTREYYVNDAGNQTGSDKRRDQRNKDIGQFFQRSAHWRGILLLGLRLVAGNSIPNCYRRRCAGEQ